MRTLEDFNKALELKKEGFNNSEISRQLDIPRRTIIDWVSGKIKLNESSKEKRKNFNPLDYLKDKKEAYSYILGLYLGDGYINKTEKSWRIRFFLDYKYDKLNDFATEELQKVFPNNKINILNHKNTKGNSSYITLYTCSVLIEKLFPQIGKGKKHERKIELTDWQKEIIDYKFLLKGLFHSDGSYYKQTNSNSFYYNFSNLSKDIIEIFCECCNKINVECKFCHTLVRGKKKYTANVRKQQFVEKLHGIIGDKKNIR
jgi:DNA-binding transcriptional regulator WhiA